MKFFLHKFLRPSSLVYASATMASAIVGLGIFGIPFVFAKAGFGVGLLFLVSLTVLMALVHVLYGEIVLRTHKRHQMIGYIKKYLGSKARWFSLFNFWISVFGFITATLIVIGDFLFQMLSALGVTTIWGMDLTTGRLSALMMIAIGYFVYRGLKTMAKIDLAMMFIFFAIVIVIATAGAFHLQFENIMFSTGRFWFLPFGVVMFALLGSHGVPLAREILVGKEKLLRKALLLGTVAPAFLYAFFAFIVVGVAGDQTSPQAIIGLAGLLGAPVVFMGALFGFLASTTIFLSVATSLNESLWQDFGMRKKLAFLLVFVPAYILFRLEIVQFINLIGLVGGVAGSVNVILLIMTYVKAKSHGDRVPEYSIIIPNGVLYIIIGLLAFGAAYTILA